MKLTLLGFTPEALAFAKDAISAGHQVRDGFDSALDALVEIPAGHARSDWEILLHTSEFDAVIVAGPLTEDRVTPDLRARREDQLRKLVQAGMPLIILPPVCEAIIGLELEMIRRDVRAVIAAYFPRAMHPVWNELIFRETAFDQITVEHALTVRDRAAVQAAFVQDAAVLRRFLGATRRVSASGGVLREKARPDLANVSVGLTGENNVSARWTVLPAALHEETRFTCYFTGGTITVIVSGNEWRLEQNDSRESFPTVNAAGLLLEELATAWNSAEKAQSPSIHWIDACRIVETLETIDRSLERGRTIELYNEELSEESTFKGTMAAGGCLLLLGTLMVFMGMGVVSFFLSLGEKQERNWGWLQLLLVAPLTIFLLLQMLAFGIPAHERKKRANYVSPEVPKLPSKPQ